MIKRPSRASAVRKDGSVAAASDLFETKLLSVVVGALAVGMASHLASEWLQIVVALVKDLVDHLVGLRLADVAHHLQRERCPSLDAFLQVEKA